MYALQPNAWNRLSHQATALLSAPPSLTMSDKQDTFVCWCCVSQVRQHSAVPLISPLGGLGRTWTAVGEKRRPLCRQRNRFCDSIIRLTRMLLLQQHRACSVSGSGWCRDACCTWEAAAAQRRPSGCGSSPSRLSIPGAPRALICSLIGKHPLDPMDLHGHSPFLGSSRAHTAVISAPCTHLTQGGCCCSGQPLPRLKRGGFRCGWPRPHCTGCCCGRSLPESEPLAQRALGCVTDPEEGL